MPKIYDTKQSEPTGSGLFPSYTAEGHGSYWKPIMRDGYISNLLKAGEEPRVALIITYTFPTQPYKSWAECYIETIRHLRRMPGASGICDDLMEKVAVKSEESFLLEN
ncbi:hypothetical protein ES705_32440 [subsurface metagenome]